VQANAIRVCTAQIQAHPTSQSVVTAGCWALHNLAFVESGAEPLAPAAAAEAAAAGKALVRGPSFAPPTATASVTEASLWALYSLPVVKEETAMGSVLPVVLHIATALQHHAASSASVVEAGLWCLSRYASVPGAQVALTQTKAFDATIAAFSRHAEHVRVAEAGCAAIASMCLFPEHQTRAAVPLVISALATHTLARPAAIAASWALANLTVNSDCQDAATRLNAVPAVLAVLASHLSSAAVAEGACRSLRNLCVAGRSANQVRLSHARALPVACPAYGGAVGFPPENACCATLLLPALLC
jgi:hypothetical protein